MVLSEVRRESCRSQNGRVYHERLAISNLFHEVTGVSNGSYELSGHEQLSSNTIRQEDELSVRTLMAYICATENPLHITDSTDSLLHHVLRKKFFRKAIGRAF